MLLTNSSQPSHEPSTAGSKLAENTPYGTPRRTPNRRNATQIGGCRSSSPVACAAARSAASPAAVAASAAAGTLRAARHSTSSDSRNASSPSRFRRSAHSSHSSSLTDASTTSREPSRNDASDGIHAGTRAPAASPRYPISAGTPAKEKAATAGSFHSTLRSGSPPGRSASTSARRRSSSSAPPKTSDSSTTPASTRFWRKASRTFPSSAPRSSLFPMSPRSPSPSSVAFEPPGLEAERQMRRGGARRRSEERGRVGEKRREEKKGRSGCGGGWE
nr:unnamed protein product [Digitaria exilis]